MRTKALAAVAAGAVLLLAVKQATTPAAPGGGGAAAGESAPVGSVTLVLAGAPRDLPEAELKRRYAAIRAAKPFQPRSFAAVAPVATGGAPARGPGRTRPTLSEAPPPDRLELRFTGLLGQGDERTAILEEPTGAGRGILARQGAVVGPIEIAVVGTDSITVVEGESRKDVPLGDAVRLPIVVSARLEALKPPPPDGLARPASGSSSSGTVGTPAPAVSSEERQAILERLRERRRQQVQGGDE
ncbi:MAG: hypothetical protein M9894_28560 [Planctomycetes bacterium]|nr:hypothetical protein [Planctomycetota bacterium]